MMSSQRRFAYFFQRKILLFIILATLLGRLATEAWPCQLGLCLVTFSASKFRHIWSDAGKTTVPYGGQPLAEMNPKRRSMVLEDWARRMLEADNTNFIEDAVPGKCINGARRGMHRAEYDFGLNGRRVEIKSSQLKWNKGRLCWEFMFFAVKFEQFDELYLVLFSPQWLHLVKHDFKVGLSTHGLATQHQGCKISLQGSRHDDWPEVLDKTLDRLCLDGSCTLVARSCTRDLAIEQLCKGHADLTSQFYAEVPLGSMSPQLRGLRVETMVLEACKMLYGTSDFRYPSLGSTHSGAQTRWNSAPFDWKMNGQRIEVKSSILQFSKSIQSWCCVFYNVKRNCFDQLLLALYSPKGIDIFEHHGSFGMSLNGIATECAGMQIRVLASVQDLDPMDALETIVAKLEQNGCPRIASILWHL